MIPTPEGETRPAAETFGFVTECFYLTHRALDLGYHVILEKLMRCVKYWAKFIVKKMSIARKDENKFAPPTINHFLGPVKTWLACVEFTAMLKVVEAPKL